LSSREFTDSHGIVWRVWDVTPTRLHPITRGEEFMEPWAGGWLTFESVKGKRRLVAPYPSRWPEYDLQQLEALCRAAELVGAKRNTPVTQHLVSVEDEADKDERGNFERTFKSPRGREWTVRVHECLTNGTTELVLRFTAGDIVVDLKDWPADWKRLSREEFAVLLLDAQPPRRLLDSERPQRRREDRPAD
jgi:hypothetical protein